MVDTFKSHAILFYIVGLGFGCSYSLVEVDAMHFVHTPLKKKLLRAAIGTGLFAGILTAFYYMGYQTSEELTNFVV